MAELPQVVVRIRPELIGGEGRFQQVLNALNGMCPPRQYVEMVLEHGHVVFHFPAPRTFEPGADAARYRQMIRRAVERACGATDFEMAS